MPVAVTPAPSPSAVTPAKAGAEREPSVCDRDELLPHLPLDIVSASVSVRVAVTPAQAGAEREPSVCDRDEISPTQLLLCKS